MARMIALTFNPYLQQLRIQVDGAENPYSSLYQYADDPFVDWCDHILEGIATAGNGEEFFLQFSSREEDALVMEILAKAYPLCRGWKFVPFIRKTPLQERMKRLNSLIRAEKIPVRTQIIKMIFILQDELAELKNELMNLELKNSFCDVRVEVYTFREFMKNRDIFENPKKKNRDTHKIFFYINKQGENISPDLLQGHSAGQAFLIQLNETAPKNWSFSEKRSNIFVYRSRPKFLIQTVYHCLLLDPLLQVFRECIATLPKSIKECHDELFEVLQSTTNRIIPVISNNTVEVAQSNSIFFKSDLPDYPVDIQKLTFTYDNAELLICDGRIVKGLKEGKCTIFVHRDGDVLPCAEMHFSVILRNRIKRITFENETVTVGEKTAFPVKFTFTPSDADNVHMIKWKSSNPEIATVNSNGDLMAHKQGSCRISCIAENVSTTFSCIVKPFLESIIPEEDNIEMIRGELRDLKIHLVPENAINGSLIFSSMDMRTVNIVGNKIQAVDVGKTRIIIEDVAHKLRKEVTVTVKAPVIKGFLSKIFG